MYVAEKYFANDSSEFVLNGDGTNKGVLYIIKEFSGTKAANLAKYYAGMSYYRLKDYNKAIEYSIAPASKLIVIHNGVEDNSSLIKKRNFCGCRVKNHKRTVLHDGSQHC